jgi:hypothetical protein
MKSSDIQLENHAGEIERRGAELTHKTFRKTLGWAHYDGG